MLPTALTGSRQRYGFGASPTTNRAFCPDLFQQPEDPRQPFELGPRICYSRNKTFFAGMSAICR